MTDPAGWPLPGGTEIIPYDAPRDAWLAERTNGLGGSDMPVLMGVANPRFSNEFDLWRQKTDRWENRDPTGTMLRGTWLEPGIADFASERMKTAFARCGLVVSHANPIFRYSPDRLGEDDSVIEIKSIGEWADVRHQWRNGGVGRGAYVQGQWGLFVTGRTSLWCVGYEIDQYPVIRGPFAPDRELHARMVVRAEEWWRAHVLSDDAPAVDHETITDAEIRSRWPTVETESVEAEFPFYLEAMRDERAEVQATLSAAERRKKEIDAAARIMAGDAAAITVDGDPVVTLNERGVAPRVDPAMEWEEPEMWAKYVTRGTTRAIRWLKPKEG